MSRIKSFNAESRKGGQPRPRAENRKEGLGFSQNLIPDLTLRPFAATPESGTLSGSLRYSFSLDSGLNSQRS